MNRKNSKKSSWYGVVILAVCFAYIAASFFSSSMLEKGAEAPSWQLRLVDGSQEVLSLEELRGKTVLLDFWSISCPPCVQELPELQYIHETMKDKNVVVVGIASWGETSDDIRRFLKRRNVSYLMALGEDNLPAQYKIQSYPTLYIIDKDGKIADAHRGFWSRRDMREALEEVLSR